MAYTYGNKSTSFNGIWLWLQRNGYTKATRSNDTSYGYCINMMREFMKVKGIRIIRSQGKFNTERNAISVQKHFQDFVEFMKSKEITKTEEL